MQWDKVKNILIVILLAVNLFLLSNLGAKAWQSKRHAEELDDNLRALLAGYEQTLDEDFRLPQDKVLPLLSLDRSRADEEAAAGAMLGGGMTRTEQEDGTVFFESETGSLEWGADGVVRGRCETGQPAPANENAALRLARTLLTRWGLQAEDAAYTTDGLSVTMTGTIAGQPVHNRLLTLRFDQAGLAELSGLWTFGTPYTTARESGVSCVASDALLAFAANAEPGGKILSMTAGYRLQSDSSRRLQFTPTWKITTDSGEYLVDCAKKMPVTQEN
ncbi:MAG: hypothetical protein Q4C72_02780 [Eubacteriales bacterium]|nr:hypothetical protein [Eubacteriales bacterium]